MGVSSTQEPDYFSATQRIHPSCHQRNRAFTDHQVAGVFPVSLRLPWRLTAGAKVPQLRLRRNVQ